MELKLRIYVAGVVSVLVYGCECWDLEECTGMIQQWNARRLALISGREIRDEYVSRALSRSTGDGESQEDEVGGGNIETRRG